MVQAIQGKHVPDLRLFARTLESWIETTTRIAKAWQPFGDIPWWYNERALVSIFAGAVWLAGGIAFEEFRTERYVRGKRTRRALHSGRQDLFIQIGKNGLFIAESKIVWSAASAPSAQPSVRIGKALDQACEEVRRTPSDGDRRLGIVFARPYVRWKHQGAIDSHIERWLEKARQVEYSCCAWVFPAESRVFGNELYILPGMAVFIREV